MTVSTQSSEPSRPAATESARWSDHVLTMMDRYRTAILGLLLLTYLIGFNGQWRPEPDSALYLSLGRNLAEGKGYTYLGQPHHLAYPGWPWILSIIFRTCGGHALFFANLAMLLMGLVSLALMYRLALLHAGRGIAVMMTVGLGISHTFYRYCFELRSDMPFMLGVMAVLAGYEGIVSRRRSAVDEDRSERSESLTPVSEVLRRPGFPVDQRGIPGLRSTSDTGVKSASDFDASPHLSRHPLWDWLLFCAGLIFAVMTRPTMWTLLAALAAAVVWGIVRGRLSKKVLIVLLIVPLCAAAFLLADPRRQGAGHQLGDYEDVLIETLSWPKLATNVHELLDPMASEALFGIDFGQVLHVGPVSLQMLGSFVAIAAGLMIFRERALWGLWFAFTVGMMIVVLARDRYFLPVLPMMIWGWWLMIRRVNFHFSRRWGNGLFLLLFACGAVPNSAKVGELFIEQRHPNVLTAIRDGRYESIHRVAAMITDHVPANGWVIAPKKFGRILTFLSGRKVVEAADVASEGQLTGDWFLLEPRDEDAESTVLQPNGMTIDPPMTMLKGPYDKQAWTLSRLSRAGGTP